MAVPVDTTPVRIHLRKNGVSAIVVAGSIDAKNKLAEGYVFAGVCATPSTEIPSPAAATPEASIEITVDGPRPFVPRFVPALDRDQSG